MILISIYNHIYELSKFIKLHPGEGINNLYLNDFKNTDATEVFERYHNTNESDEMLKKAMDNGYDEETGIYYVCPYFFKKKIPKYFKFLINDPYGIDYFKNMPNGTFILRPSNSNRKTSLCITYKDEESQVKQLKIRLMNNLWNTLWENEDGDTEDIIEKYIEDIIDKIMINNEYTFMK